MSASAATDGMAGLIAAARAAGADAADAILVSSTAVSVVRRVGRTEKLERSEERDLGLRVFVGDCSAIVSTTTVDPAGFRVLAERAVAMARVVPPDPFAGLAERMAPVEDAGLDLEDSAEPDVLALTERAARAEAAAMAVPGVTNSEGADAGYSRTEVVLVTSAGFAGRYVRTGHSVSAVAVAGSGTAMERDYDYASAVHLQDLEDAEAIGRAAGQQAVARLNPTRPRTARLPVVFDPRVAGSLLGHLVSAINGSAIARGTSFLRDALGQPVFGPAVQVRDEPRRVRGLKSRPFDGEGVPTRDTAIIRDGVLTTWLLDSRSARQLGLSSTGHAARGTGGPPSPAPSNLCLAPGPLSPAELMADIREGLYVTELMGTSVNGITGDYSRGAAGFMIRDGALAEPVAEITVAGTLQEMFRHLTPGSDLRLRRGTDAPTVRVEGMTMAGA